MFDKRLMLSYLDGLISESAKKRFEKVQQLKKKGTPAAEKAASEVEEREHRRFVKHLDARKNTPGVKKGIERRQEEKREQKKTSHSTRLSQQIDKISDQILNRIGSKDPERQAEKRMMKGHRAKLEARLEKVKTREESGGRSKREVRKEKKQGPDLY